MTDALTRAADARTLLSKLDHVQDGLTARDVQMLMALSAGRMNMGSLAKCLGMTPANTSTRAGKLELNEYLNRAIDTGNRRVVWAMLTCKGLDVAERGMKIAKEGKP